jgi:hypothetical protein
VGSRQGIRKSALNFVSGFDWAIEVLHARIPAIGYLNDVKKSSM